MNLTVGVLGGTGAQGRGLAYRWARAGVPVVLGSRDGARAEATANEINEWPGIAARVSGADNEATAKQADVVLVAVPWDGHAGLLSSLADALAGKIVVDCVNPLGFDKQGPFPLAVPEGSAAQQAAALLPGSQVTAAFHHVSAELLADPSATLDQDVLVLGEDREAIGVVISLADQIEGTRGVYAGRLRNAHQVEAFTANLIAINRRYKTHAGVRITGLSVPRTD